MYTTYDCKYHHKYGKNNQLVIITFNASKPLEPSTKRHNYDDVVIVTDHVVVFTKEYV